MKKVSILSMQEIDNYGSVLQAYSLKKIIQSLDCNVGFISIILGKDNELNSQYIEEVYEENEENILVKQSKRLRGKLERMKQKRIFSSFRSEYGLNSQSIDETSDVCVIGSDEVFNCMQKAKWGFSPQLFGDVKSADKIITYAASCGFTRIEDLSDEKKKEVKKAMLNLSSISVRDKNTATFVESILGRKAVYHLDPVAVGDFDEEINNISLDSKLPSKYCILYSYAGRFENDEEISGIQEYCEKHKLQIIAPFGRQEWIRSYKMLTPFELLKAFQMAECIVTDTFHGTLFGAKFGKKMAVLIRESNRNKLEDLVRRLQIQEHVITDISQLGRVLDKNLKKEQINEILKSEKLRTLEYLKENL